MHFGTIRVAFWEFGAIPQKMFEKGVKKAPLGAHLGANMEPKIHHKSIKM
jgi:hypothetical protein